MLQSSFLQALFWLQKQPFADSFQGSCSLKFHKIHGETAVSEFFKNFADLQLY